MDIDGCDGWDIQNMLGNDFAVCDDDEEVGFFVGQSLFEVFGFFAIFFGSETERVGSDDFCVEFFCCGFDDVGSDFEAASDGLVGVRDDTDEVVTGV